MFAVKAKPCRFVPQDKTDTNAADGFIVNVNRYNRTDTTERNDCIYEVTAAFELYKKSHR